MDGERIRFLNHVTLKTISSARRPQQIFSPPSSCIWYHVAPVQLWIPALWNYPHEMCSRCLCQLDVCVDAWLVWNLGTWKLMAHAWGRGMHSRTSNESNKPETGSDQMTLKHQIWGPDHNVIFQRSQHVHTLLFFVSDGIWSWSSAVCGLCNSIIRSRFIYD